MSYCLKAIISFTQYSIFFGREAVAFFSGKEGAGGRGGCYVEIQFSIFHFFQIKGSGCVFHRAREGVGRGGDAILTRCMMSSTHHLLSRLDFTASFTATFHKIQTTTTLKSSSQQIYKHKVEMISPFPPFLAVQDSSIGDLVTQ